MDTCNTMHHNLTQLNYFLPLSGHPQPSPLPPLGSCWKVSGCFCNKANKDHLRKSTPDAVICQETSQLPVSSFYSVISALGGGTSNLDVVVNILVIIGKEIYRFKRRKETKNLILFNMLHVYRNNILLMSKK